MKPGQGLARVVITRLEGGERRRFHGLMPCAPTVGASLVVIRDDGLRLMTSRVVRVLADDEGRYWVETANSVYRMVATPLVTPAAAAPSSVGGSEPR
jgi:hypothetical protein